MLAVRTFRRWEKGRRGRALGFLAKEKVESLMNSLGNSIPFSLGRDNAETA